MGYVREARQSHEANQFGIRCIISRWRLALAPAMPSMNAASTAAMAAETVRMALLFSAGLLAAFVPAAPRVQDSEAKAATQCLPDHVRGTFTPCPCSPFASSAGSVHLCGPPRLCAPEGRCWPPVRLCGAAPGGLGRAARRGSAPGAAGARVAGGALRGVLRLHQPLLSHRAEGMAVRRHGEAEAHSELLEAEHYRQRCVGSVRLSLRRLPRFEGGVWCSQLVSCV